MTQSDPEMLWAFLLVDGLARLSEEEQGELALWVAGMGPDRGHLAPESGAEASHVAELAVALVTRGLPELAVPLARLALAGQERFYGPDSDLALDGVFILAVALVRCVAADECMPAGEAIAVAERFCATGDEGGLEVLLLDLVGLGRELVERGLAEQAVAPLSRARDGLAGGARGVAAYWLGLALWRAGGHDAEAEAALREALALHAAVLGEDGEGTRAVRRVLGVFLWGRGRLFGRTLPAQRALHGDRFDLAVALLRAVAAEGDGEQCDRLEAEAAMLLAAAGRNDAAHAIAKRLGPSRDTWIGARVHARIVRSLLERGEDEAATAALVEAVGEARATHIHEGGEDRAWYDLAEAVDAPTLRLALSALAPDALGPFVERAIEACLDDDDLDGALAVFEDWGGDLLEAGCAHTLALRAAQAGRPEVVRRLIPHLTAADRPVDGVEALFDAGLEAEALALMAVLGPDSWTQLEARSLAARHFGTAGDRSAFSTHAEWVCAELAAGKPVFPFQQLHRLAEGALGLMVRHEALDWAQANLSDALLPDFTNGLARALAALGRLDEAFIVADRLPEPDRGRVVDSLRLGQGSDALAHSDKLAGWGRFDDAVSALASLANPFAYVQGCIAVAEKAAAAGDETAAAEALKAALARLPGPVDGILHHEHLRLDLGRRLGEAVARLLPPAWRDAFAEAALAEAAKIADVDAAAPRVVAAGYASRGR